MYWHLTVAAAGRSRLWTTEAELARVLRALGRIVGRGLLLFCVVDDHLHAVLEGERLAASRVARHLRCSLGRMGSSVEPARVRPVEDRDHLYALVEYVLRQPVRHDLGTHPAAWPGSCLADLVGARRLPGFDPDGIRRALPRMDPGRFWRAVELAQPVVALDDAVRSLGPRGGVLVGTAAALVADLDSRTDAAVTARAVAVGLLLSAEVPPRWIATDTGIPARTVRHLRRYGVDPRVEQVVERQLCLRHAVRTATPVTPNASEQRAIARSRMRSGDPWVGTRPTQA